MSTDTDTTSTTEIEAGAILDRAQRGPQHQSAADLARAEEEYEHSVDRWIDSQLEN